MSLATVLQIKLEVCYGFVGDFGLYLEKIRFRVTFTCFPQSREDPGSGS